MVAIEKNLVPKSGSMISVALLRVAAQQDGQAIGGVT